MAGRANFNWKFKFAKGPTKIPPKGHDWPAGHVVETGDPVVQLTVKFKFITYTVHDI